MPILDTEILWRPAALNSVAVPAQNGGRMAFSALTSGVKNNLFPDVSQSERDAGLLTWRKAFVHVASQADTALLNLRLFLDALTPGGDFVLFQPGTQTDTQDQIAGRPYGVGALYAPLTAGAVQLRIAGEDNANYATLQPFRLGDLLRVSDRPSTGGAGNEEWVTVTGILYGPDYATVDFTPALVNGYATANTLVASVHAPPDLVAACSGMVVTSTGGSFTPAGNLIAHNKGAVADDWTLTFTSASQYTAAGTVSGALAALGSVAADYAPLNPATGTPFFTVKASAWGGAFAANDAVRFSTAPAAIPLWYRRQVPPGTASLANDFCSLAIIGESA